MKTLLSLLFILNSLVAFSIDYGDTDVEAVNYTNPKRELSVIITPEGYYPKEFSVFVGEKVNFFVTNLSKKQSCMIIREKDFYLSSTRGKISEGSVVFDKPGVYSYYCPTGKIQGKLTVLERFVSKTKREIASEKKKSVVRYWLPREE